MSCAFKMLAHLICCSQGFAFAVAVGADPNIIGVTHQLLYGRSYQRNHGSVSSVLCLSRYFPQLPSWLLSIKPGGLVIRVIIAIITG